MLAGGVCPRCVADKRSFAMHDRQIEKATGSGHFSIDSAQGRPFDAPNSKGAWLSGWPDSAGVMFQFVLGLQEGEYFTDRAASQHFLVNWTVRGRGSWNSNSVDWC